MKKILLLLSLAMSVTALAQGNFTEREVTFSRTDARGREVRFAGTLSVPGGEAGRAYPAMVLITGSGAQNRDEELMGHKPFKVIADYFAARGYVVLRCDDRGVGGTTGAFDDVTTLDLADDVEAMYQYLGQQPCVNSQHIGLVGHSEGGLIAPIVASRRPRVAFVVLLAGPGMNGAQTLLAQNEDIFRQRGLPDTLVSRRLAFMTDVFDSMDSLLLQRRFHPEDTTDMVKYLNRAFKPIQQRHGAGLTKEQKQLTGLTNAECYGWAVAMASPWMQTFCTLEPADYLSQLCCPVLALGGARDLQVRASDNLAAIEAVCRHANVDVTTRIFPGMNHLFQLCETGAVEEYATLGQSPDPSVLKAIYHWLDSRR